MIYLHEYDYSKGFNSYHQIEAFFQSLADRGFAVFAYDMLGFGNRIEEGTRFYDRYPHWSKLGKMVVDVKAAVEALTNFDFIDRGHIFVAGYSLGRHRRPVCRRIGRSHRRRCVRGRLHPHALGYCG